MAEAGEMNPVSKSTDVPVTMSHCGSAATSSLEKAKEPNPHPKPGRGIASSYKGANWLRARSGSASRPNVGIMHLASSGSLSIDGRRFGGNNGEGPKPRPTVT